GDAEPDTDGAIIEAHPDSVEDRKLFFISGHAMSRFVARQKSAGIVHDRHARRHVARARAEINECLALSFRIKWSNGRHADLQFQRGGYAVMGFEVVVFGVLPV